MHDVIPKPIALAIDQASHDSGVTPDEVELISFEEVEWPDSSLGVPQSGVLYAQMITPGYRVVLGVAGQEIHYHTDSGDRVVRAL